MSSASFVLACALGLLGRSAETLPPVQFIAHPPVGVSQFAQGYVLADEGQIVLVTSTEAFTQAQHDRCKDIDALREIASVLAHEEWHLRHGPDEASAYDAQLIALFRMGANVEGQLFHKVQRAKFAVLAAAKRTTPGGLMVRSGAPDSPDGSR